MTDLEMTKLCAEAMDMDSDTSAGYVQCWRRPVSDGATAFRYDPLHDDAQAMALDGFLLRRGWIGISPEGFILTDTRGRDIVHFKGNMHYPARRRRARVECVAKMQTTKASA